MLDQRQSLRRRTFLDGRIGVAKLNGWALDCTVRNLSQTGARVRIPADTLVPDTFELGISGATPVSARLVWYRDGEAGVTIGVRGSTPDSAYFTRL